MIKCKNLVNILDKFFAIISKTKIYIYCFALQDFFGIGKLLKVCMSIIVVSISN